MQPVKIIRRARPNEFKALNDIVNEAYKEETGYFRLESEKGLRLDQEFKEIQGLLSDTHVVILVCVEVMATPDEVDLIKKLQLRIVEEIVEDVQNGSSVKNALYGKYGGMFGKYGCLLQGKIMACSKLVVKADKKETYCGMLACPEKFSNCGIGTLMTDIADLVTLGIGYDLTFDVISHREKIITWYQRMGIKVTGTQPYDRMEFVRDEWKEKTWLVMMQMPIATLDDKVNKKAKKLRLKRKTSSYMAPPAPTPMVMARL